MAAVRPMMSVVREQAAVLGSEIAATAKTGAVEAVKVAEAEVVNPLAARQVAELAVKDTAGTESSILSHHLSVTKNVQITNPSSLRPTVDVSTTRTESLVMRTVENDLGFSVRDAMMNASQTGAEESMEQVADQAKEIAGSTASAAS